MFISTPTSSWLPLLPCLSDPSEGPYTYIQYAHITRRLNVYDKQDPIKRVEHIAKLALTVLTTSGTCTRYVAVDS